MRNPEFSPQLLTKWVWWFTPIIPELGRWKEQGQKFRVILGYEVRLKSALVP